MIINRHKDYYINDLKVRGVIEWTEIGEGIDMEDGTGISWVIGKDDSGKSFTAVGDIVDGLIDDIDETTLEELN